MDRRTLLASLTAASASAASAGTGAAQTAPGDRGAPVGGGPAGPDPLDAALRRYDALPGTKACLIHAGPGGALLRVAQSQETVLFTASAFKTFVLGQALREIEAGRLSGTEPLVIDDGVRMFGSPTFQELAGRTQARAVLEAMIAHSDNTATDAAMRRVGADRIRALVAEAGLGAIRIGDTTRLFSSYVLGERAGVDLGWPRVVQEIEHPTMPRRPLLNDVVTLAGSARDFVAWYEQALSGRPFRRPETLAEFRRIQSMSGQIAEAVPPDTVAYAKGGEIPAILGPLNAKSFAGQMVVGGGRRVPVTFAFLANWDGPADQFPAVEARYFAAIRGLLEVLKERFQ